jgi:hypothetical protein
VPIAPDNLPDDPAALKRIIAAMAQDALTAASDRIAGSGRGSRGRGRSAEAGAAPAAGTSA